MKTLFLLIFIFFTNSYAATSTEELERRINLLNDEIQQLKIHKLGTLVPSSAQSQNYGLGRAASKVYSISKGVSIGGYGEILYTNYRGDNEQGTPSGLSPQTEALRNIIYLGYKFDDNWIFNSEIEIEHVDEIFLEFAYLDRIINDQINFRAGLLLIPVGFLNLYHEPNTFLSANRPDIEKYIIPSTWRENGLGIYGSWNKFNYQAYVVNGLDGDAFSDAGVRSGRKKGGAGGKTDASTYAITARLDYNINSDALIGASIYSGESSSAAKQGNSNMNLVELHGQWKYKGFYTRALFVQTKLSNISYLNSVGGNVGETMSGYYVELGYNILNKDLQQSLTPYLRYENFDTQEDVSLGITKNQARARENLTLGIAYQPQDQIIFKVDYTVRKNDAKTGVDEFNASLGYMF